MSRIVDDLARRQLAVARPSSFDLARADSEFRRLSDCGTLLQLTKGFYALIPEDRRGPDSTWRPSIEGSALGIAAALYGPDEVALVGPSAARVHRCYPRALGTAYVAVPRAPRPRDTAAGTVRFVQRDIAKLDTVRVVTDLGSGWATSYEQTALDLCRDRPTWNITDEARSEMIRLLADRIDWNLIDDIAKATRGVKTLHRLRTLLRHTES